MGNGIGGDIRGGKIRHFLFYIDDQRGGVPSSFRRRRFAEKNCIKIRLLRFGAGRTRKNLSDEVERYIIDYLDRSFKTVNIILSF